MGRFGHDGNAALDAPADKDLGRASAEAVCDTRDHRVTQQSTRAQRAVGLDRDIPFGAGVKEGFSVGRRVEMNLVDGGTVARAMT